MEKLDLEQGRWVPVESMLSRRSTLGVAVLDGCLYAVGGFDGTNGLDTVEKYNLGKSLETLPRQYTCVCLVSYPVMCHPVRNGLVNKVESFGSIPPKW